MGLCRRYVGIACIDGTCPKANVVVYGERCIPVIDKCEDCWYYEGCYDCAWCNTEFCDYER